MKAVFINHHGRVDVLNYGDLPCPEPGPGQVLVRLKFAALNRLDLWVRHGWPGIKLQYPHILGADGAGEVAAFGDSVRAWQVGDRVVINPNLSCGHCPECLSGFDNRCRSWGLLGETSNGTYAEFVAVPEDNLLGLPDGFDDETAAAAGLVYVTAWHSLMERARVKAGETVLVVGASGGVNTASIQIARHAGARVIVVGAGEEKLALASVLGAEHTIDRLRFDNWAKVVYELTDKRGVDVVVDNVGTTFPMSLRCVCKGGRIVTVGNTGGAKFEIDNRYIFSKHLSILGSTMGTRQDFARVMELVFTGRLRPLIDRRYILQDIREAQEHLDSGKQMGKITVQIQ